MRSAPTQACGKSRAHGADAIERLRKLIASPEGTDVAPHQLLELAHQGERRSAACAVPPRTARIGSRCGRAASLIQLAMARLLRVLVE